MIDVEKIQFRKIDYSYYKLHYEKLKNVYIEGSISINWKNRNKINSLITAYNNFDFILQHMSHTVIFLIALDEDAIIGWLIASLSFKNYCQIASLYIDVEYRGMGLATRMLVYLESLTDYEYLWTEAFNDDELFVKSGFIKSDDQFFEKLTNHKRRNCYIKKIRAL